MQIVYSVDATPIVSTRSDVIFSYCGLLCLSSIHIYAQGVVIDVCINYRSLVFDIVGIQICIFDSHLILAVN